MKYSSILSAVRTPIGKFGGKLAHYSAVQLASIAITEAVKRAGLTPEQVDLTIMGHARQAANGPNPARQAALASGIPVERPAWTLNQACASGLASIDHAHKALLLGDAQVVVAGGMESMSRVPYYLEKARWGLGLGHERLVDGMYRDGFFCPMSDMVMGETAEILVDEFDISRLEQDEFAAESQQKCQQAREAGKFADEIVGVEITERRETVHMTADEHPRDNITSEKLNRLKPVYELEERAGTITAGNASGITDGAAALVLATPEMAEKLGLQEIGRYTGGVVAGCEPKKMGLGPVVAAVELERRFGKRVADFDIVELNEAFAAQVIACQRTLAIPAEKLNPNGGSIALGHPIGCTGNRMAVTLLHELRRRGGGRGLVTACVSGGFGIAGMFEV